MSSEQQRVFSKPEEKVAYDLDQGERLKEKKCQDKQKYMDDIPLEGEEKLIGASKDLQLEGDKRGQLAGRPAFNRAAPRVCSGYLRAERRRKGLEVESEGCRTSPSIKHRGRVRKERQRARGPSIPESIPLIAPLTSDSYSSLPSQSLGPRFTFGGPSELALLSFRPSYYYTQRIYTGVNASSRQPLKYGGDPTLNRQPYQDVCSNAFHRLISACRNAVRNAPETSQGPSSVFAALIEFQRYALGARHDEGATIWPLKEIFKRYKDLEISVSNHKNAGSASPEWQDALGVLEIRMGEIVRAVNSLNRDFSREYGQRCEEDVCEIRTVSMYTPETSGGRGWKACTIDPADGMLVQVSLRTCPSTISPNTLWEFGKESFFASPSTVDGAGSTAAFTDRGSASTIFDNSFLRSRMPPRSFRNKASRSRRF